MSCSNFSLYCYIIRLGLQPRLRQVVMHMFFAALYIFVVHFDFAMSMSFSDITVRLS